LNFENIDIENNDGPRIEMLGLELNLLQPEYRIVKYDLTLNINGDS